MSTETVGINSSGYQATQVRDVISSPTLDGEEQERYRELFGRLTCDERREEQEVTRLVLAARARDFDEEGLL